MLEVASTAPGGRQQSTARWGAMTHDERVLYTLGALGNVRTETLRAFTSQETEAALARVA
jgi:hypothetical protein